MTLSESRGFSLLLLLMALAVAGGAFGWWMMRIPPGNPNEESPSMATRHTETAHRATPSLAPPSPSPSAVIGDNDETEARTETAEPTNPGAENHVPMEAAQALPLEDTESLNDTESLDDAENFTEIDQGVTTAAGESEPVPGAREHRGARITTRARQIETLVVAEQRARNQLQEAEAAQDGQRVGQLRELLRQLGVRRTLLEEAAADSR